MHHWSAYFLNCTRRFALPIIKIPPPARRFTLSLSVFMFMCTLYTRVGGAGVWTLSHTLRFQSITTDPRKGRFRFLLAFIE